MIGIEHLELCDDIFMILSRAVCILDTNNADRYRNSSYGIKNKLEKVAIIGMYWHFRPPDVIAFGTSNLSCR